MFPFKRNLSQEELLQYMFMQQTIYWDPMVYGCCTRLQGTLGKTSEQKSFLSWGVCVPVMQKNVIHIILKGNDMIWDEKSWEENSGVMDKRRWSGVQGKVESAMSLSDRPKEVLLRRWSSRGWEGHMDIPGKRDLGR